MNHQRRFPWFGLVLIGVGAALLLEKFGVISFESSTLIWVLLMLFGMLRVGQGFSAGHCGKIFFGTITFLYGLYFLLHTIDSIEMRPHLFVPASFIIFGLAFLMMYLNNYREWIYLLPAFLLTGAGTMYLMNRLGYFDAWDVGEAIRVYWPIGLIVVGVVIVARRRAAIQPPVQPPPAGSAGNAAA